MNKVLDRRSPYVIAEIGVNHEGSYSLAESLIKAAADAGADAVKFQTYKAEKLTIRNSPAYWSLDDEPTDSQYKLFKKYDSFEAEDYVRLARCASQLNVDFMSTPFDLESVDLLDPLVKVHKISSSDIQNVPLLRKVAKTGKPLILSTGASTDIEIQFAIDTVREVAPVPITLMHCVLSYPTRRADANLGLITYLSRAFSDVLIGYSDHTRATPDMDVLRAATLLGAKVIEKHFTHDKSIKGNDHYHAMDGIDLRTFRSRIIDDLTLLGESTNSREILPCEEKSRIYARRSVVYARNLKNGDILQETDLLCKRPDTGVSSRHWDDIIGRRLTQDVIADQQFQFEQTQR